MGIEYENELSFAYIKTFLSKGTLLVIDDVCNLEDESLGDILQTDADVIITTRINCNDLFSENIQINLDCMDTKVLKNIFNNNSERYDCVVLGCTHYSLVKPEIQKFFPQAKIVDGNIGVANRVKELKLVVEK